MIMVLFLLVYTDIVHCVMAFRRLVQASHKEKGHKLSYFNKLMNKRLKTQLYTTVLPPQGVLIVIINSRLSPTVIDSSAIRACLVIINI